MDGPYDAAFLALQGAVALNTIASSPLSDVEDGPWPEQEPKRERRDSSLEPAHPLEAKLLDGLPDDLTPTTLRPEPAPSRKRRESETGHASPERNDKPENTKKRKRGESPPWQFPTAKTTTLKSADGRRVSARVNTNTPPLMSDASTRARSSSQSVPPHPRTRPESPPWKKFAAAGPTTVVVDGKRKSGRVNKELTNPPKRVSPRSKKQIDQGSRNQRVQAPRTGAAGRPSHAPVNGTSHTRQHLPPTRKLANNSMKGSSVNDTIAELRAKIDALQPTRSFLSPERAKHGNHKRKRSTEQGSSQIDPPSTPSDRHSSAAVSPDSQRKMPKLKLRFNAARYIVPPPHPNAIFQAPARPPSLSIYQAFDKCDLKELRQPYIENGNPIPDDAWLLERAKRQTLEEAVKEASWRRKILKEAEPGGKLSEDLLSIYKNVDAQQEAPQQYGHNDHLVAHALHLRRLQLREKTHHRALAKRVAHEALDFWRALHGPTEDELREEQDKILKLIHKQVIADIKAKWAMVEAHVQHERLQAWQAAEEVKRQARLREKLEWSENMVARQRGEAEDEYSDDEDADAESEGSSEESEEENMSESGSEAEDGEGGEEDTEIAEMGEAELAGYIAQRKAESQPRPDDDVPADSLHTSLAAQDPMRTDLLDSPSHEGETPQDASMADLLDDAEGEDQEDENEFYPEGDQSETDHVEDHPTDTEQSFCRSRRSSPAPMIEGDDEHDLSSDESTDMDSTDYDSDENMSSSGEDQSGGEEGDEGSGNEQFVPRNSLLSLFKDEVKAIGLPTPTTSAEGDEGERQAEAGAVLTHDDKEDRTLAGAGVPPTDVETEEPEIVGSEAVGGSGPVESPASDVSDTEPITDTSLTKHAVPSPSLLRGTLRSYQHTGLEWLASLYRNGTNGILADEMGLGKTIQAIALLAHLAEEHECWDPHLVIVPTSVVLNWVTEFQRFLPGFRVLGYYGSSDERQLKRKGWVNDPHHENKERRGYNVVITSYHVAMQDINAIRNVQWHYLVLDEAHNIRNFNSQRWQVLIRLKTRARLLLTGTPLQNSLTELWSLLTFLTAGDDDPQHGDLEEFLSHWKEPVKEIFDRGVQTLSHEAQKVVDQLHISLRPFLLRRLKSEVEKDLPKKTENVVVCKLSKRQRQLYQDYMGLAETRKSLTQGNAVTAGKVLLSLRRVCNHPDLFDPRPIQTSFGMEQSALDPYSTKERAVRQLLGASAGIAVRVTTFEGKRKYSVRRANQLNGGGRLESELAILEKEQPANSEPDATTLAGCQAMQKLRQREKELAQLRSCIEISRTSLQAAPVYGSDLRELLTVRRDQSYRVVSKDIRGRILSRTLRGWPALGRYPLRFEMDHASDWMLSKTSILQRSVQTTQDYAERMGDTIARFAFCTPPVTAPVLGYVIPERTQRIARASNFYPVEVDEAHEARMRTSIAFPDSRLLIYDAGKLQRLTGLLRELQSRGSRSLIFTQMTGTLNILEQFLSLLNLPYLRLDGSTPVERRALYAAEFNRPDSKYQCMILSSRAGGVGLNLIGASSVIFYDLDWNPQMDRQCMDRAHRIGQVRDVEVYKMVSEKTVEENILRRANQKSLLDQTVIQEGRFTTEYQRPQHVAEDEEDADVAAGIERFLGGSNETATNQALESVEDKEDFQAAQQARKEDQQDDADFAPERSSKGPSAAATPGSGNEDGEQDEDGHIDNWMIRLMDKFLLFGVPVTLPAVRKLDRHGRDPSHRKRRR